MTPKQNVVNWRIANSPIEKAGHHRPASHTATESSDHSRAGKAAPRRPNAHLKKTPIRYFNSTQKNPKRILKAPRFCSPAFSSILWMWTRRADPYGGGEARSSIFGFPLLDTELNQPEFRSVLRCGHRGHSTLHTHREIRSSAFSSCAKWGSVSRQPAVSRVLFGHNFEIPFRLFFDLFFLFS
jgi:hypothetical protein